MTLWIGRIGHMSCREELGTETVESPIVIDECAGEDVL